MIKIGQNIGAFTTVFLIFATAFIGIYLAKIEGINTLRSGVYNLYKNKIPIYEMISGASIAFAAVLLMPPTRKIIVNYFLKRKSVKGDRENFIEGEILEKDRKDKDEL